MSSRYSGGRRVALLAVVFAILVAITPAAVVGTHTELVVASQNTTDSDFNSATTLNNLTVKGSGNAAYVELTSIDYDVVRDEGDGTRENANDRFIGDDSSNNALWAETRLNPNADGDITQLGFYIDEAGGSDYGYTVNIRIVQETPDGTVGEGTLVKSNFDPDHSTGWQTVDISDYSVSGGTDYTVEWITDSSDNDGNFDSLNIGYDDSATNVWYRRTGGSGQNIYPQVNASSGGAVFEYGNYTGQTHTVEDAQQANVNLTLDNAEADITIEEDSGGGSWSDVASSTVSTTANHTIDISSATENTLRVRVNFTNKSGKTAAELHDESILFDARGPDIDNASATPTGDLSQSQQTFEIDLNDSDFALAQSDQLTAELFIDGSSEGTDTLNSNGTASVTTTVTDGGSHTYNWTITDSYNINHTSQDFTINVPDTLVLREELPPHKKIDTATVEAIFYEDVEDNPTIINESTNNGEISLTGLPVGSEFSVKIDAPEYENRTVIIDDIYTQNTAFLINKSNSVTIENRFLVDDATGNFPPEDTEIIIQKAINQSLYGSGGFAWLNVAGDDLGADQAFVTDLIDEDRYRIIAQNEQGDERVLGSYSAETAGDIQLEIGTLTMTVPNDTSFNVTAYFDQSADTVTFEYADGADNTTEIGLKIYEYQNESNTLYDQINTGTYGSFKVVQAVDPPNESSWVVEWNITRSGEDRSGSFVVGQKEFVDIGMSDFWEALIGSAALVVIAGLFGGLRSQMGIIAVPLVAGGLWLIGWLPGAVGAGAIILALTIGVIYMTSSPEGVPAR